jgi:hypothetical protein
LRRLIARTRMKTANATMAKLTTALRNKPTLSVTAPASRAAASVS